jgi:peptide/nickel transport system substrate-binding protein
VGLTLASRLGSVAIAFGVTAATACTPTAPVDRSGGPPPGGSSASPVGGGTLRVVMPTEDAFTRFLAPEPDPAVLDPQRDDLPYSSGAFLRCCLARTLMSHNGRSTEEGGARLHADLAEALPDVSADGLVWTFRLKPGLRYGPPLEDVEITSADFVRAFHRFLAINTDIAFLFLDVEGAEAYANGDAASISGLETPNARTLVIRLTEAAGDLGARLALPMVSPLPPSPADPDARFGVAEGHDDGYGRYLVSSGPYMLEGSDRLDFNRPVADREPVMGLVLGESITLVRNPSWARDTDALRPAYPDRVEVTLEKTIAEAIDRVRAGTADIVVAVPNAPPTLPPELIAGFGSERTHVAYYDTARGLAMNLAMPPFDDVHVRRAANLVVNKSRLIDLGGGPLAGEVAGHMAPDSVEDNLLRDYDPYATAGHAGDAARAHEEMSQSEYDGDRDGNCDHDSCRSVRAIALPLQEGVAEALREDLRTIGIQLDLEVSDHGKAFSTWEDPRERVALFVGIGWNKIQLSASSFFKDQFYGLASSAGDVGNGTLVGASPEQLRRWGYDDVEVPSVDERIDACLPLTHAAEFECWAALDQHLMQNVVPWVPYQFDRFVTVTSDRVTSYSFDQLSMAPAYDRITVDE